MSLKKFLNVEKHFCPQKYQNVSYHMNSLTQITINLKLSRIVKIFHKIKNLFVLGVLYCRFFWQYIPGDKL